MPRPEVERRRLELSLDPTDGSLRTAPLSSVLYSITDSLYQDLHDMAQGEVSVVTEDGESKLDRLASLSFKQRRHQLSWRLASHSARVSHAAALTATKDSWRQCRLGGFEWTQQADECQDALYFDVHAQLFPSRQAPADVFGAADVLLAGKWYDIWAQDVRLDSAQKGIEKSLEEVKHEWTTAVRRKLVMGEVGWLRRQHQAPPWKICVRGGVVKLSHQAVEALVTVVPVENPTWKLLSLNISVRAKTGEFQYQLEPSKRQQFDLHRLAALSMGREEIRGRKEKSTIGAPPRPLHALFAVSQRFSLSWQLEVLSAQAQGMRRGVWAAGAKNVLQVSPVQLFDGDDDDILGAMSILFWRVDDSYGPPTVSFLNSNGEARTVPRKYLPPSSSGQLVLTIQAVAWKGIRVALSGAEGILGHQQRTKSTIQDLVEAVSNPLALSASDALLAATRLCAERKCDAVVQAITPFLPSWIVVELENGSIAFGARVMYFGQKGDGTNRSLSTLFRLQCDMRSGSFVPTFDRSMDLLRRLAGNHSSASEAMSIRIARLPPSRRKSAGVRATTGRLVREAFDSLIRSMNVLGHRAAVGGTWEDIHQQSVQLRQRSIQSVCNDVRKVVGKCCGMATLYGLVPMALASGVGLNGKPDLTGGQLNPMDGIKFVDTPPVSVRVQSEIVEMETASTDGVLRKSTRIDETLLSFTCTVDEDKGVTVVPLEVSISIDSPSSLPIIQNVDILSLGSDEEPETAHGALNGNSETTRGGLQYPTVEAEHLASLIIHLMDNEET